MQVQSNNTSTCATMDDEDLLPVEMSEDEKKPSPRKYEFAWHVCSALAFIHIASIYGIYALFTSAQIKTILFAVLMYYMGGMGTTAGVHRLWSHKSYKAKWPLRLFLMICNSLSFQGTIFQWARDHRMHHKYADTDLDPYNSRRGFFYSHMGWLLVRKHPAIKANAHKIYIQDLLDDPIVYFQKKYWIILTFLLAYTFPAIIPIYFWNEHLMNGFSVNFLRYTFTLHAIWLVNSFAHMFGNKPYDKSINPAENVYVSAFAWGEGWHNYHHTFPWDYKTSELGGYKTNVAALFIDIMAKLGQAYDLKTVNDDMIKKRVKRTGDGSHDLWGWGDRDQKAEDKEGTVITYREKAY